MKSDESNLHMLPAAFEHARGEKTDKDWAELVLGRMYLENVNEALVRTELNKALILVRESGESPEGLYGDPFDYVDAQIEQWRSEGAPMLPVEPPTSWRDVPVLAASVATFIVFMFAILELISGNWSTDYTLGKLLAPTLIGVTTLVGLTTLETRLRRTRRLWAVAVALVPAATGIMLTAVIFAVGNDSPVMTGPLWWYVPLTALHALAAIALSRHFPHGEAHRTRAVPEATDGDQDDEWASQLAGILRLRLEMPEKEVRATIVEARQHAQNNGTTLTEEFGPSHSYASRLPRSTPGMRARQRWVRIAWIVGLPVFGYLAFEGLQDGWAWDNVRWFMVLAFAASCLTVTGFFRERSGR